MFYNNFPELQKDSVKIFYGRLIIFLLILLVAPVNSFALSSSFFLGQGAKGGGSTGDPTTTPAPTNTSPPAPTATPTPAPTLTPTATDTPMTLPTDTPSSTPTSTPPPAATSTPTPTLTSMPGAIVTSGAAYATFNDPGALVVQNHPHPLSPTPGGLLGDSVGSVEHCTPDTGKTQDDDEVPCG